MQGNYFDYLTSIGRLYITVCEGRLKRIDFLAQRDFEQFLHAETQQTYDIYKQIEEYLNGERREFDIEMDMGNKTAFTKLVYDELKKVSYGTTISYGQLAIRAKSPNASRAVGNILNKNPIPIIVPCHRILGANGALVGYRGGIEIKKHLLDLENKYIKDEA